MDVAEVKVEVEEVSIVDSTPKDEVLSLPVKGIMARIIVAIL